MPQGSSSLRSAFILIVFAAIGCDSVEFVPSPPEELRGSVETGSTTTAPLAPSSAESSQTNGAEFIGFKRSTADEFELVSAAIRTQSGYDKIRVKILGLGETTSKADEPSSQAALIRKAISRHPRALIVEVENPKNPELVTAVNEARAAGIIVLLVGPALAGLETPEKAVTPTSSAKPTQKLAPLIVVAPVSFNKSAADLVASALRNAKTAGIADRKSALILLDTTADAMVNQRAAAIQAALKAAGITDVQELRFVHDVQAIDKKLTELLKSNPKIGLVFPVDLTTTTAVVLTLDELIPDRPFVASAYTWESTQLKSVTYSQFAAAAEYSPLKMIRRAITAAAAAILRGETPPIVDVPVVAQDSPTLSALSQSVTILTKSKPDTPPK